MLAAVALLAATAASQDEPPPDAVLEPDDGRLVIDILADQPTDPIAAERCDREADVARVAGEIVVCRERTDRGPPMFDREGWERDYAERTQGPKTPNVDSSGIQLPTEGSLIAITVTLARFGGGGPPPLMIDIEALPEAPAGSDADRIARGLPPLDGGAGADDISEEDLGLPPVPSR